MERFEKTIDARYYCIIIGRQNRCIGTQKTIKGKQIKIKL